MRPFAALGYRGQVGRLKKMALAALAQYDLAFADLTPLTHEENTTFRVEAAQGERYVLRISRPGKNPLQAVQSEMIWLDALARDTDLVLPGPQATRDGALATPVTVAGVPEPRICVLFRWVEGSFLNRELTATHLYNLGRFIARLHDHAAGFVLPASFSRSQVGQVDERWQEETLRRVAAVRPADDVALLRAIIEKIRVAAAPLDQTPDAYGLIHADMHQWNYLFHEDEARAIDFDDCGFGPHVYDLAVTLYELQDHDNYSDLRAALLAGYRSLRPLPDEHEAALAAFVARRRLDMIMWNIDSREHPAFRDRWFAHVSYDLNKLRDFVAV